MESQGTKKSFSGRYVVVAIVAFALLLVFLMWLYLDRHTAPFRPLQRAIHDEFPNSAPLVQGGQRKIHRSSPKILRITLRVDFDPNEDQRRVEDIVQRLTELAGQNQDMSSYDEMEFHLVWFRSEKSAKTKTITRSLSDHAAASQFEDTPANPPEG